MKKWINLWDTIYFIIVNFEKVLIFLKKLQIIKLVQHLKIDSSFFISSQPINYNSITHMIIFDIDFES